jgi:hypothetical protein
MPTVSDYVVILDQDISIPSAVTGANDFHSNAFDLPESQTRASSVLYFKVKPIGNCTLHVVLNNTQLMNQSFETGPERSWHEVISAPILPFARSAPLARMFWWRAAAHG